jgi:uncharacterized protein YceH (UPF0502 family)
MQLLAPDLHDINAPAAATAQAPAAQNESLLQRVENLEAEVAALKEMVQRLASALGETGG